MLVAPDSSLRKGARPGWTGGLYDVMRRALTSPDGRALYRLSANALVRGPDRGPGEEPDELDLLQSLYGDDAPLPTDGGGNVVLEDFDAVVDLNYERLLRVCPRSS